VPIPANPNALQQAKAAGIDLSRLGLERDAVVVSKKGLYEVAWLAQLLSELSYLEDVVEWEAEYEGDGRSAAWWRRVTLIAASTRSRSTSR
jgi:hypothetical protein